MEEKRNMKCPRCKRQLRDGARYCTACGTKIEKKRGNRLTSVLLIVVLILSFAIVGCFGGVLLAKYFGGANNIFASRPGKNDGSEQPAIRLSSDIKDVIVKNETSVTFSAKVSLDKQPDEISIICENETIGILRDNGQNDDAVKNDGIYTGIVKLYSETETHREYYAQVGEVCSNSVSIFFYSELTEEDIDNFAEVNDRLSEIQTQYLDEDGFISKEKIPTMLDVFCEELETYVTAGIVESFSANQDNIYIKFSSGIPFMFIPNQKDTLSSGNTGEIIAIEPAASTLAVSSMYNIFIELDKKYNKLEYQGKYDVLSCAEYIANATDAYSYKSHLKDNNVTVGNVQSLGSGKLADGILLWEGHGAYDEDLGSVLVTGEKATIKDNIKKYSADLKDERIITTGGWQTLGTDFLNCNYAITAKYIDIYFAEDSLRNCFVYLGACSSGTDSRLADSFINKGASVVFASVGVIGMEFEIITRTTILYNMCKEKENGQLYSANEALDMTRSTIGMYDSSNEGTYVNWFGDGEFRFSVDEAHTIHNDAYETYLAAAQKTTAPGKWSEHMDMTADMTMANGKTTSETKVTLTSEANITHYSESDPSQIRISGSAEMRLMGQQYAWDMEYENGTAHYQYTKPEKTSADMKIDPNIFNFGTMSREMMTNAKMTGNTIAFTVPGEEFTKVGVAAVNQMHGVDKLEYGDVDVTVTIGAEGKIDSIAMIFHASLNYQGFDTDVDYHIDYRFADYPEKTEKPAAGNKDDLRECLDISKSWGIRKDIPWDGDLKMEQIYDFAFMENGEFYCYFYQQYTDFMYGFHGTYLFEDYQLTLRFDGEGGTHVYSFDPNAMKLTQVSKSGMWDMSPGTEYDLINDEWFPSAQDVIDAAKRAIDYNGNSDSVIWSNMPTEFRCITVNGTAFWKIDLGENGHFNATFSTSNFGEWESDYPQGTCYITKISGQFSEIEKIDAYSFRMVADSVETTAQAGEVYIEDGIRYIVEEKSVIDNGDVFYLYLPGVSHSDLPQGLVESVNNNGYYTMDNITSSTYVFYQPNPELRGYELVYLGESDVISTPLS